MCRRSSYRPCPHAPVSARIPTTPASNNSACRRSIEAEQAVLGGLMLAEAYDRINDKLTANDFYRRDHQLIYRAIAELAEEPPVRRGDAGRVVRVSQGHTWTWSPAARLSGRTGQHHAVRRQYRRPCAEIVRDKAVMRQLIEVGTEIVSSAFQPEGKESDEMLAIAEQKVFAIAEQGARGRTDFVAMNDALKDAFEVLRVRSESGGTVTGLPTGYTEFDMMTAGLQPTDLVILAARPAMGKTTFALNIAEYAAIKSKKAVAVFSMEMSAGQLAMRLISSVGRINATRLRTGQLEDEDWSRVTSAIRILKDQAKVFIDDTPGLSPDVLRSKAHAG